MKRISYVLIAAVPLMMLFTNTAYAAPRAPEHLIITMDPAAPPGTPSPATATGPIHGTGTDTQTTDRTAGQTDHATDLLTFPDGTVLVKDRGVNGGSFDPVTCTLHVDAKGTFTIVGGTGAYSNAKGHGHFTVTGTVQATADPSVPGGCSFEQPPTGSIVVDATGTVSL